MKINLKKVDFDQFVAGKSFRRFVVRDANTYVSFSKEKVATKMANGNHFKALNDFLMSVDLSENDDQHMGDRLLVLAIKSKRKEALEIVVSHFDRYLSANWAGRLRVAKQTGSAITYKRVQEYEQTIGAWRRQHESLIALHGDNLKEPLHDFDQGNYTESLKEYTYNRLGYQLVSRGKTQEFKELAEGYLQASADWEGFLLDAVGDGVEIMQVVFDHGWAHGIRNWPWKDLLKEAGKYSDSDVLVNAVNELKAKN